MLKHFNWKKIIPYLFIFLTLGLSFYLLADTALAQVRDAGTGVNLAEQVASGGVYTAWNWIRSFVNILAVLGLLVIAFANILHINLDTYAVRRMLPALILGIILANFSNVLCRVVIDFVSILTSAAIGTGDCAVTGGNITTMTGLRAIINAAGNFTSAVSGSALGLPALVGGFFLISNIGTSFILFIILFILAVLPTTILLLCVGFMLYARLYIVWFLVIISPVCFFGLAFSPLGFAWKKWINYFIMWCFLGPAVFLILRIGVIVTCSNSLSGVNSFGIWIFGVAMLYLCLKMPGILGGALAGAVGAFGNFIGMKKQASQGLGMGAKAVGMGGLNRAANTRVGGAVMGRIENLRWSANQRQLARERGQRSAKQAAMARDLRNPRLRGGRRTVTQNEYDKANDETARVFAESSHPTGLRGLIQADANWEAYRNGTLRNPDAAATINQRMRAIQLQCDSKDPEISRAAQQEWQHLASQITHRYNPETNEVETIDGAAMYGNGYAGGIVPTDADGHPTAPANTAVNRGNWRGSYHP